MSRTQAVPDDELKSWYFSLAHLAEQGIAGIAPTPVLLALLRKGGNAGALAARLLNHREPPSEKPEPEEWWNA